MLSTVSPGPGTPNMPTEFNECEYEFGTTINIYRHSFLHRRSLELIWKAMGATETRWPSGSSQKHTLWDATGPLHSLHPRVLWPCQRCFVNSCSVCCSNCSSVERVYWSRSRSCISEATWSAWLSHEAGTMCAPPRLTHSPSHPRSSLTVAAEQLCTAWPLTSPAGLPPGPRAGWPVHAGLLPRHGAPALLILRLPALSPRSRGSVFRVW